MIEGLVVQQFSGFVTMVACSLCLDCAFVRLPRVPRTQYDFPHHMTPEGNQPWNIHTHIALVAFV